MVAVSTGCLINLDHAYFKYGKSHDNKPALGTVIIDQGMPIAHPMITDKHGRWIGKL